MLGAFAISSRIRPCCSNRPIVDGSAASGCLASSSLDERWLMFVGDEEAMSHAAAIRGALTADFSGIATLRGALTVLRGERRRM